MTEWLETYRGVVNPWECDVVQHFTIAYYFDRFADATRNFIDLVGENDILMPACAMGHAGVARPFSTSCEPAPGFTS